MFGVYQTQPLTPVILNLPRTKSARKSAHVRLCCCRFLQKCVGTHFTRLNNQTPQREMLPGVQASDRHFYHRSKVCNGAMGQVEKDSAEKELGKGTGKEDNNGKLLKTLQFEVFQCRTVVL